MKKQIKNFNQFNRNFSKPIKESKEFDMSSSITLNDLVKCYVKNEYPRSLVLVAIDISNPARDLMFGGIEVIENPTEDQIDELVSIGYYHVELYENGVSIETLT